MPRNASDGSGGEQAAVRGAHREAEAPARGYCRREELLCEALADTEAGSAARKAQRNTLVEDLLASEPANQRECRPGAVLLRTDRRGCGQLVEFEGSCLRMGRSPDVEARFDDASVSRMHAEIVERGGQYFVADLDSANGTFVDGRRIERSALRDKAVLGLGPRVKMRFSILGEDERLALGCLQDLGHYDPLTRVYNRRYLGQHLAAELAFAERHQTCISIVLLDVDHFKRVNDTYGHPLGDEVLAKLARIAGAQVRAEDVVARYGGEEFMIVLRQTPVEGARALAERIGQAVREAAVEAPGGQTVRVTLSAGCASLSCPGVRSAADLIRLADRRLYRAKEEGRDQVVASGEPELRSAPTPDATTGPTSRVRAVDQAARAFEQLDDELRVVVGLHFQEECSFIEIAAVLDLPEDQVRERFSRAMAAIRAA